MKQILFILASIPFSLFAQTKAEDIVVPKWGKIDKADMEMKACDFEPDAEAYKLLDWADVYYEFSPSPTKSNFFRIRAEYRIRIKILKETGFSEADIKIPFYSYHNSEYIEGLKAVTYNQDEKGNIVETKVDNANIFEEKTTDTYSRKIFTFPAIKVGSIIEYKYSHIYERENYISGWRFQDNIPVKLSQLNLSIPEYYKFIPNFKITLPIIRKEEESSQTITIRDDIMLMIVKKKHYSMTNIPALKYEPFMGAPNDWYQSVDFNLTAIEIPGFLYRDYSSSWSKVNTRLLDFEYFGQQLNKKLTKADFIIDSANKRKTTEEKVKYLYQFVKKNLVWDERVSLYCKSVKDTWTEKKGNNTEINFVLLNLLKAANVEAYPLCISTKRHGRINTVVADEDQFNGVDVLVINGERVYILDATEKHTPYFLIPSDILNTEGYIIDKEKNGWVSILDGFKKEKNIVSIVASIDKDGLLKGDATISSIDYARVDRLDTYDEGYKKFRETYFDANSNSFKIDTIEFAYIKEDEKPFEQKIRFSKKLNISGDYQYFTLNMFTELTKNPFTKINRTSDIDFGVTRSYGIYGIYELPENYMVEELPKNLAMIMPDTSIIVKRIMQVDGNTLNVRINLDFQRSIYYPAEYEEFKEFYKKLFGILNEQIVLKKKGK
jgi:Domain of Unknown Function with PDB structure (DUF3857)